MKMWSEFFFREVSMMELKSRSFCEKVGVFYILYDKTVSCWPPSATVSFAAESSVVLIIKAKKAIRNVIGEAQCSVVIV